MEKPEVPLDPAIASCLREASAYYDSIIERLRSNAKLLMEAGIGEDDAKAWNRRTRRTQRSAKATVMDMETSARWVNSHLFHPVISERVAHWVNYAQTQPIAKLRKILESVPEFADENEAVADIVRRRLKQRRRAL